MSTRQQLTSMEIGAIRDVVFSNGILRSTKELCKDEDNEFTLYSHDCYATLTLDQAVDFIEGKLEGVNLYWEECEWE